LTAATRLAAIEKPRMLCICSGTLGRRLFSSWITLDVQVQLCKAPTSNLFYAGSECIVATSHTSWPIDTSLRLHLPSSMHSTMLSNAPAARMFFYNLLTFINTLLNLPVARVSVSKAQDTSWMCRCSYFHRL